MSEGAINSESVLAILQEVIEARAKIIASDHLYRIAENYRDKSYLPHKWPYRDSKKRRMHRKWFLSLSSTMYHQARKLRT